jgi:hypothetical protein
MIMSIVNVLVFATKKMRAWPLQQYLLVMSVADGMYTLTMVIMTTLISYCVSEREKNSSEDSDIKVCFAYALFNIWLSDFLSSSIALFNICVEILVMYQRILLISREARNEKMRRPSFVCAFIFTISLVVYSPVLFMSHIRTEAIRNEITGAVRREYFVEKTEFGKSESGLLIMKLTVFVRIGLVIVVLSIVNVIASIKFTAFYKKKSALKDIIRGLFNFSNNPLSLILIDFCFFFRFKQYSI